MKRYKNLKNLLDFRNQSIKIKGYEKEKNYKVQ